MRRGSQTPLHDAAYTGNGTAARMLLARGMQPNVADEDGWTPLHYTARRRNDGAVTRLLLAAGANVDVLGVKPAMTPLQVAVWNGARAVAEILVEAGAHIDAWILQLARFENLTCVTAAWDAWNPGTLRRCFILACVNHTTR